MHVRRAFLIGENASAQFDGDLLPGLHLKLRIPDQDAVEVEDDTSESAHGCTQKKLSLDIRDPESTRRADRARVMREQPYAPPGPLRRVWRDRSTQTMFGLEHPACSESRGIRWREYRRFHRQRAAPHRLASGARHRLRGCTGTHRH